LLLDRWALMRPRQWVKNAFVLAGLFFSDQLFEARAVGKAAAAAAAFCLISSAVYCFNDIADMQADAAHPRKSQRPVAAGLVAPRQAAGQGVALLVAAAAIVGATRLAWEVVAVLVGYVALNGLYSTWLKHSSLVDVVVVAAGFVLRLVAGTYAVEVSPSSWIVLSTGLLALFLALAKRRGDLSLEGSAHRRALGGYTIAFVDQALAMTGASTTVVYALFTVSDYAQQRFDAPLLYLTTFPVVIGILRYLQLVMVEGGYGSPEELALRDRPLQVVGALWVLVFAAFVYA
jgi:4-hydroxybenzoate polyprenyltransferase